MILRNKSLAFRLVFLILSSITLIFCFTFIYNYYLTRRILIDMIEKNARQLALATTHHIDNVLSTVQKVPESVAPLLEKAYFLSEIRINEMIRTILENNPEVYGSTIAFEPYAFDENKFKYAPYMYRHSGGLKLTHIPYAYFTWDWYRIPKELNQPVWSEPYYDEGAGNIMMSTYSVPFYYLDEGKRKLFGIVTIDISLSWLQKIVNSIKTGKTGYGFLISRNGTYITHPIGNYLMDETIFSVADRYNDERMREIGRAMVQGKSGFVQISSRMAGQCWLVYAPLPTNGWSLGVLFPKDELMADLSNLNRNMLLLHIIGFVILLFVIIWIARSITQPLRTLSRATENISAGNLDFELQPLKSGDEVGKLAESFISMKVSLKQYIRDLTEVTASKERIESELKVAHDIQMGILPKIFPPFPDRHEIDLYAVLEPAKEVGGDLYDFFFMDEDHLCLAIGDVSDKGVPASLFMAIARTLIKIKASKGLTPDIVLDRVNEDLSMDNPSLMFVTLFLGILDIRTGEFIYSNGGHNPPYLIRPDHGEITPLEKTNGMALGVKRDFQYQSKKIVLQKGDIIFLYTDGVTEAMNKERALFSTARLEEALLVLKDQEIKDIVDSLMERVRAFSQGMLQSDDITMLTLRFWGE